MKMNFVKKGLLSGLIMCIIILFTCCNKNPDEIILPEQVIKDTIIYSGVPQNDKIFLDETGYFYVHLNEYSSNSGRYSSYYSAEAAEIGERIEGEEVIPNNQTQLETMYLSWEDVDKIVYPEMQSWLKNSYLDSIMKEVFITITEDGMYAHYRNGKTQVKAKALIMEISKEGTFKFSTHYPSELYNIKEIVTKDGYKWICFSYMGDNDKEYNISVIADGRIICEFQFEDCDNNFILETLEACNGKGIPFSNKR